MSIRQKVLTGLAYCVLCLVSWQEHEAWNNFVFVVFIILREVTQQWLKEISVSTSNNIPAAMIYAV